MSIGCLDLVIVAGGSGTRMKDYFPGIPKLLFEFNGESLLERYLSEIPARSVYISLGVNSEKVVSFAKSKHLPVICSVESSPLGAFGGLKDVVKKNFENLSQQIIVVLGDVFLTDIAKDLESAAKCDDGNYVFHSKNDHPFDSDRVLLSGNKVLDVVKKTDQVGEKKTNRTVSGIYIFDKQDVLGAPFEKGDIGIDFLPFLAKKNKLWGARLTGVLKDVGTIDRFRAIESAIDSGMVNSRGSKAGRRVAIFDLDGTIIEDRGSAPRAELPPIRIVSEVLPLLKYCNENFIPALVVTNQGDLAKGFKTIHELQYDLWQTELALSNSGCWVDEIYFCPHYPLKGFDGEVPKLKVSCDCRKPETGLFKQLDKTWRVEPSSSIMLGDTAVDSEFAEKTNLGRYFNLPRDSDSRTRVVSHAIEFLVNGVML